MAFTVKNIAHARDMVARARETALRLREKTEDAIGIGIQMAEVTGASFGLAYVNARWGTQGELAVAGVPVDLGLAVVLHGTAFLGGFGKYAEHGHNLGTGALAAVAYRTGVQIGTTAAHHAYGARPPSALPWTPPPTWHPLPESAHAAPQSPGVSVPVYPESVPSGGT